MDKVYIFGAHSRARTLREYLTKIYPEVAIQAYLVDNDEENPEETDGIPVYYISDHESVKDLSLDWTVYLGIKGVNQLAVIKHLDSLGFKNIIPVTVELDTELRNKYLDIVYAEKGEKFVKLDTFLDATGSDNFTGSRADNDIRIYVASSAFDSELQEKHDYYGFEKIIQVGCALTDNRIDNSVYDNLGDNISARNKQFCELTALYWIWKNASEKYVGLEHYRRFFIIPDNLTDIMKKNGIDVILPTPLFVAPNLESNYKFRHIEKMWDDMIEYLSNEHVDEIEKAKDFFLGGLYSPCNMIIARKIVFDDFCSWLFPILFYVADKNGVVEDRYQNRYPGFLSERLLSLFFYLHKEELKVVYADKVFLK